MHVVRQLARSHARHAFSRRCFATATATPGGSVSRANASAPVIPLSNVEAQWEKLTPEEQQVVQQQIDEVQKKDWKTLSMDEKKAAYYVAFGPHGPRAPATPPGQGVKILLATVIGLIVATTMSWSIRNTAPPAPVTRSREWQEAMNERAREQQMNPISGVASEGYNRKGFVHLPDDSGLKKD